MAHYLGIDVGTSAVKAVIVDEAQLIIGECDVPLGISRPHPLWSEQNPDDWRDAVFAALDQFARGHRGAMADVRAIGLSGQMHGAVLLDAGLKPLRPAMLWNDARAGGEAQALARAYPDLAQEVGVLPMPGFTAPKMPWLAKHEPQILPNLFKLMLPKDYIRLQLSGEIATDMSDAAGTWLLDEARRDWSPRALAAVGLSREQMPRLVEGDAASGALKPELCARWGFPARVVIAGGGGDAAAGAVGIGAIHQGDAFLSLGTSGQLFVATERYCPAPETMVHAFCHALPQRWFQMGAMLSAASCLAFAAGLFGCEVKDLLDEAEKKNHGPGALLFLPYLTGERTPHNDPNAKGVIFGLTPGSGRAQVTQAILEGVAFSFADAALCLARSGTHIERAGLIGGGARSRFWMQLIADVLGIPLVRYAASARGPAFGAARLARLAHSGEAAEAVCAAPPVEDVLEPRRERHAAYAPRLARYRALYQAVKGEFEA